MGWTTPDSSVMVATLTAAGYGAPRHAGGCPDRGNGPDAPHRGGDECRRTRGDLGRGGVGAMNRGVHAAYVADAGHAVTGSSQGPGSSQAAHGPSGAGQCSSSGSPGPVG